MNIRQTLIFFFACLMTITMLTVFNQAQASTDLTKLNEGIINVKQQGQLVLAPEGYRKADKKLERAQKQEKHKNIKEMKKATKAGLKALKKANQDAKKSMEVLQEALSVRDKAIDAGAPDYFHKKFGNVDKQLESVTRLIEKGKIEEAKKRQPELMKKYSELEIEALKKGTVDLAKSKIELAKQEGAENTATKTLKLANAELTLALSVLEADRTNTKKADSHANRATRLAGKAQEINKLSKLFKNNNWKHEDIILWYQEQLQMIFKSLNEDIYFNQPNRTLTTNLKKSVDALIENQITTGKLLEKKQTELAELQTQLDKQLSSAKQAQLLEERHKQRFADVRAQFTEDEATVFRKGDDVLISAHGFYFPVGSSQISTKNFTLLNKISSAIRQFPGSKVKISGHTDSTGNATKNLQLSIKRAQSVAKFLTEVGMIDADRLSDEGFGDKKPVANNKTTAGRSLNRRIEVYIQNKE